MSGSYTNSNVQTVIRVGHEYRIKKSLTNKLILIMQAKSILAHE